MRGVRGWGLVIAVALTSVMWAQSDTVQGTATVGATKVMLTSGMAVGYNGPSGPLVSVLLSDKPADRKEFATDTTVGAGEPLALGLFEGAWKAQHIGKRLAGFAFTIGAKGDLQSNEFLVGGRNNTFSLIDSDLVIEVKSTSPRLVGRVRTKAPTVEAGSTKAGLDATFDLAVEQRK